MRLRALRHDWPVRWAHHPLCARHANETWRIGRLHLCRGCVSLALGLFGTAIALFWAEGGWCLPALVVLVPTVVALSWPPLYRNLPRPARDALRVGAGALIVLTGWALWRHPVHAWPLLPVLFGLWHWFARARARIQARSCEGCPELGMPGVCSGYALQAACMRALQAQIERELSLPLSGSGDLPIWIKPPR